MPAAEQLFEKIGNSRWTPLAVNLFALLLLSYSLAQWTWRLMEPAAPPRAQQPAVVVADNTADLRELTNANLFGQVDLSAGQNNLSPATIPLTSLNLVLTGIMMRGIGGFAIVSANGGEATSYAVGDEILAGATLHAVHPDRALLRRAGMLESMLLKESAVLPEGAIVTSLQYRGAGSLAGIQGSGNNFTVQRNTLTQQMQKPEFLTQALMVPNAGGGFLVREIQPGSIYEKLGVRTGDVIRSVNGQPINNMEEVMKLYQQLGGVNQAGSVSIEIMRGGRSESLQYSLQ